MCVDNDGGSGGTGTASESGASTTGGSEAIGGKGGGDQGTAGASGLGNAGIGGVGVIGLGGSATGEAGASEAGGMAGAPTVECTAAVPQVLSEPSRRRCDVGECYCSFEACYPEAAAAACCGQTPICADGGEVAEVDCSGKHPIIGPPRTCEPGFCLCSKAQVIDVCLPQDTAPYCCPAGVDLDCAE